MSTLADSLLIIIVLYETQPDESASFQSILRIASEDAPLNLFIYDNSEEPQYIKKYRGLKITYKHDPLNSGVSLAYNLGVAKAQELGKKWVLLLDQDTTLPSEILEHYNRAIVNHPKLQLFVPVLLLGNGRIFSPCAYKFKRGFYIDKICEGIHSLYRYAPVNSGIMVNVKAFLECGGYNEKVKLDFSDFQFIERFRKIHSDFYVLGARCSQEFSNDEISFDIQARRFRFFCEGARAIEKDGIGEWIQYAIIVLLRTLKLSLRFKTLHFINVCFRSFL